MLIHQKSQLFGSTVGFLKDGPVPIPPPWWGTFMAAPAQRNSQAGNGNAFMNIDMSNIFYNLI
jgi:hypothetical protein